MTTGYCDCLCRDCFNVAVTDNHGNPQMCGPCQHAGCEENKECQRIDAYGCEEQEVL